MPESQIRSPLPGTFYRKPAPDQPPFKEAGDRVEVDDVVGLVEVMKSFHEVKSDVSGVIVQFLIKNEHPISPGQVIAEVTTDE